MDFSDKIDYSVLQAEGVSIGETLKLVNQSFSAYLYVLGFDSDSTPIVEYRHVKYHKEIDWENSRYGAGDAFEDGDIMPYMYSDFGKLPNMGLIPPSEIDDLEPLNIDPNNMPKGLYNISMQEYDYESDGYAPDKKRRR